MRSFVQLLCLFLELCSLKCQKWPIFFFFLLLLLFSADDSKKSVSGWVTYFSESESSYLILFENTMDYWLLSFYQQNVNS